MKLSKGVAFGTPLVRIEGEVDPEDAEALEQAAWQAFGADGIQMVLDLGCCSHLSSTGLGVLFSLVRWVGPKGGRVIAIGPSAQLLRVLQLVELTREPSFQIFVDLESAREAILQSASD